MKNTQDELIRRLEGMKVLNKRKKYDGNNLKEACDMYCIAAESWTEIIRYEDGHDAAINNAISLVREVCGETPRD